MDIPDKELLAPEPPRAIISSLEANARTAAVYGKAKGLKNLPHFERLEFLWISGVNEAAARIVDEMMGLRRLVIHDLRVADLQFLSKLTRLRDLAIAGSPKLRTLSGIEPLRHLQTLILFDNCNYGNLEPLTHLSQLETLCLEGGFSKLLRIESLGPLAGLLRLRRLRLASIKVVDRSLRPLHGLKDLRQVFIAKTFPPSEFLALSAAVPEARTR